MAKERAVKESAAKVSLVSGDSRKDNIKQALGLIKGDLEISGKVLIKPNLTAVHQEYANTHVDAVEGVIEFLNDNFTGLKIVVGESSGVAHLTGKSTEYVFKKFGYYGLKRYGNVELANFDDWREFAEIPVRMVKGESRLRVVKHDFDYVISLAIPKTHDFAIATLGIKNMMGLVHKEDRIRMHGFRSGGFLQTGNSILSIFPDIIARPLKEVGKMVVSYFSAYSKSVRAINRNLAELAKAARPNLVVLDGMYGMEGEGPVAGEAVKLGVAVASTDPLKADGVGARLMGLAPQNVGYLHYLQRDGYGDYSLDGLVGEKVEGHIKKFRMHPRYSVQKCWRQK